jgi:hypothetical protein
MKNTLYGPHENPELQKLFQAKPWQGQKPENANIIFVALDANYAPDVDVNLIRQYHESASQSVVDTNNYADAFVSHLP